jgi:hypothetical protein
VVGTRFVLYPPHNPRVPHISLVFREMWDSTAVARTSTTKQSPPMRRPGPLIQHSSAPFLISWVGRRPIDTPLVLEARKALGHKRPLLIGGIARTRSGLVHYVQVEFDWPRRHLMKEGEFHG